MSVDELGQAAARGVRGAAATIDPDVMLRRLQQHRRRRQVASMVAVAVSCAVVLAGIVELARPEAKPVASRPRPSATAPIDDRCNNVTIVCLGGNTFRVAVTVPVTVTLPANFGDLIRFGETSFESYRTDLDSSGVTVMEDAVPVRNDASWSRDPSAGDSAAAMATWLSKRPFLSGATLTPTTVDGRPAWRVSAVLKPHAPLRAVKLQEGAVAPTFTNGNVTTMGYSRSLRGDYTLLDVPGAGVTVVWSWTLAPRSTPLGDNRPFIDGLRWG
jgi:hypothetical protein